MGVFSMAVGSLLVLITALDVILTLVLPRRPAGVERLSLVVNRSVRLAFIAVSRLARSYEGKDALLAPMGPVALLALLAVWLGMFVTGYALILEHAVGGFSNAFTQASVSLFSVGTEHAGGPRDQVVDIATGATWAVVVALQIAYLPALYDAFTRRESLVAMLESRAGLPAWGPELLARHQLVGIVDTLPEFYAEWERWAADLAESHTTYPVLLLFRSPEPWYSWLVGLLAVLDGAAMHLALAPASASSKARLCLRMGFTATGRIASALGWHGDPDPGPEGPIALTFEEFRKAVQMLQDVGFPMERTAEEAWPDFRGWRVNYETTVYRLADRVVAPPAPWSGSRSHLRSGPVSPHRPPQRRPAGTAVDARRRVASLAARAQGEPGAATLRHVPVGEDETPGSS